MNESCQNFEGNSDFYGLGIRIGVYLQWFSSWISNSVNPDAAATNHDTNTIFLCALLIATAVAFADGSLQLVEKYVLLLLSSGFFCTVLSFLGLRLRLLQPSSLRPFRQASQKALRKALEWYITSILELRVRISPMVFSHDSKFRHWALSWSGVIVRSAIGCFLAVLSLLTWWANPATTAERADPCVTTVYFFGSRDLSGNLFTFFRVATIILTIPVGYLLWIFAYFLITLRTHIMNWVSRNMVLRAVEFVFPGAWDRLDGNLRPSLKGLKLFGSCANEKGPGRQPRIPRQEAMNSSDSDRTPYSDEFCNINAGDCPPLSHLVQALMSMLNRGVDSVEAKGDAISRSEKSAMVDRCMSAAAHVLTLVTMACFVLFTERTMLVAGISGVNTLNATGQLIPFVTGVVSLVVALRDLVLGLLRKEFPQWDKYHIKYNFDVFGNYVPNVAVVGSMISIHESSDSPAQDASHASTAV